MRPYDPSLVYLSKARTDMPEAEPPLPQIENPDGSLWNPQTWLLATMGSKELADVIVELVNWCLRPRSFTDDKFVIFKASSGSNGKGTILALLRAILGGPAGIGVRSIPLEVFGRDAGSFMLSPLVGAVANLVDESDGNAYMSTSSTLKAAVAHDPITINRKNRDPIEVALFVPMIFSLNELPRMKDRTAAMDRRMHVIPFTSRFMDSGDATKKNPAIKQDYVLRDEVRRWFMWQALRVVGDIDHLSTPPAVADALEDFREENVGAVGFWREYSSSFDNCAAAGRLEFLPFKMLYAMYVAYSKKIGAQGIEKLQTFIKQITEAAAKDAWVVEKGGSGDAQRARRYTNCWGGREACALAEIAGDLGLATKREQDTYEGKRYVEEVRGDLDFAAWTVVGGAGYDFGRPVERRRTAKIPDRLQGLIRPGSSPQPNSTAPRAIAPDVVVDDVDSSPATQNDHTINDSGAITF